jgi:hypothetical protein
VITDCTLYDNTAGEEGGGIDNNDMMTVDHCALSDNYATYGGGIANWWVRPPPGIQAC